MSKVKYYSLTEILKHNADYNIIFGERSNGKTTAVLAYGLQEHIKSGYVNQLGIIRRWDEDFKAGNGSRVFEGIVKLGWIEKWTNGLYNSVRYFSRRWYLCCYDEEGNKVREAGEPFALGFSISSEEHYKSTAFPNIQTILFDEFITRKLYLPEEFVKFQNLLSTIIRLRSDVKIFMCGNTINRYCPYFAEMGLKNVKNQERGSIDVYTYGTSALKVAVEYADFDTKKKDSNKYFAFDNPKLAMITQGGWEIDIYPHLPEKYKPDDVIYHFYIRFEGETLQANIVDVSENPFIYIHRKTTPIKEDNEQLVYQQECSYKWNHRHNLLRPFSKLEKYITELFKKKKIFYQDNEVGEIVNNFLKWCVTN